MGSFKVPSYEPQVGIQTQNTAEAPAAPRPPAAAFGGEVAESDQRVGQAVAGLGEMLARRVVERQQRDDEQQLLSTHTDFLKGTQLMLYASETDASGRPKGIMNRRLDHAKDATVEFDKAYLKQRQDLLEQMPERLKAPLAARLDASSLPMRELVIRHESRQGEEAYKSSLDSNIKQQVSLAAALSTPEDLNHAIDVALVTHRGIARLGVSKDEMEGGAQLIAGDMAKASIEATIDRDPRAAQRMLDSVGRRIPPNVFASLRRTVEIKMLAEESAGLWDSMTSGDSFRLEDGGWDLREMQKAVLELDAPQERKERLWDYIKARANEDTAIRRMEDQAKLERQDDIERELFIRSGNGQLPLAQADSLLARGDIGIPFYEKLRGRILNVNDDPAIPDDQKSERFLEVFDAFKKLRGATVDADGKPLSPASKNDLKTLARFRELVAESAPYLTKRQERDFYAYTQRNFNEAHEAKVGILDGLLRRLRAMPLSPLGMSSVFSGAMSRIMAPTVSVDKALEDARLIGEQQAVATNPNRTQYQVGQVLALPGGTVKVIGFDSDGEPLVEVLK